jgi:hypothetical protein
LSSDWEPEVHFALALYQLSKSPRARRALETLALEARTLLAAFAHPHQIIEEVKTMRAMQVEADRLEPTQPARAAVLRYQAARIGL